LLHFGVYFGLYCGGCVLVAFWWPNTENIYGGM
jgi:hypothetical protein